MELEPPLPRVFRSFWTISWVVEWKGLMRLREDRDLGLIISRAKIMRNGPANFKTRKLLVLTSLAGCGLEFGVLKFAIKIVRNRVMAIAARPDWDLVKMMAVMIRIDRNLWVLEVESK